MFQVVEYWHMFQIKYGNNRQTGVIEDFYRDRHFGIFPIRASLVKYELGYRHHSKKTKYVKASILYK